MSGPTVYTAPPAPRRQCEAPVSPDGERVSRTILHQGGAGWKSRIWTSGGHAPESSSPGIRGAPMTVRSGCAVGDRPVVPPLECARCPLRGRGDVGSPPLDPERARPDVSPIVTRMIPVPADSGVPRQCDADHAGRARPALDVISGERAAAAPALRIPARADVSGLHLFGVRRSHVARPDPSRDRPARECPACAISRAPTNR